MSVVLLGGNRFIDCDSILAHNGTPLLIVRFGPLRLELATPPTSVTQVRVNDKEAAPPGRVQVVSSPVSIAIFWQFYALAIATLLDADTAHLRLDLRPLGINIHDDLDGLHIGKNVFSGNVVSHSAAAINLGD